MIFPLLLLLMLIITTGCCAFIASYLIHGRLRYGDEFRILVFGLGLGIIVEASGLGYILSTSSGAPNETRECDSELYVLRNMISNKIREPDGDDYYEVILEQVDSGDREFAVANLDIDAQKASLPVFVVCSKGKKMRSLKLLPDLTDKKN